jgi:hypothetical protein
VRKVTHPLRLRGPLAGDSTAELLHTLVLALAIWFAAWSLFTLPLYSTLVAVLLRLRFVVMAELVPVRAAPGHRIVESEERLPYGAQKNR